MGWLNPPGLGEKELQKRTLTNLYNERPEWLDAAHRKLDAAGVESPTDGHRKSGRGMKMAAYVSGCLSGVKEPTKRMRLPSLLQVCTEYVPGVRRSPSTSTTR